MNKTSRTLSPPFERLTGAVLAAQRDSFRAPADWPHLYGLPRSRLKRIIAGQDPITPTIELIYQLASRYPELLEAPPDIEAYLDALAQVGVLNKGRASRLLGRQRLSLLDYRRGVRISQLVGGLMAQILRVLAHHSIEELEAVVEEVYAQPVSGERLLALEEHRKRTEVRVMLGLDDPRYYQLLKRKHLPTTVGIFIRLLERFPDQALPTASETLEMFYDTMRRQGLETDTAISRCLGRVRQATGRYRRGDMLPSATVLSLMNLIMRFLETHPFSEYLLIVNAVAEAYEYDPKQGRWGPNR
ncbi:MAG: hypothetical protein H6970_09925 [Gammaproteobacteria bacterium]|nr:hypothetical protein [Gammaproteobacteria bacterium]